MHINSPGKGLSCDIFRALHTVKFMTLHVKELCDFLVFLASIVGNPSSFYKLIMNLFSNYGS